MKLHLKIILLFISLKSYSQIINGRIIDSITKEPIEFANVTFLHRDLGVSSDDLGLFKIKIIDNKDNLQISSVGYQKKFFNLSEFNEDKIYTVDIELAPKTEKLEEVVIINKKINYTGLKTLGLSKKLKVRTGFPFGYEFCNYIKNPTNKKGKIKNIILSLNEKKDFDYIATYNIKFYEYDSINKKPGEEIYFENLIIEPQNKTYKLKIDVDSLKIKLPANGVCIGVEILNTKYKENIKTMSIIAPSINFTHTQMEVLTWNRYRSKKWIVGTHKSQVKDSFVNAMINIEVQIEK